jgi:transcriptional/translational regulatory protein YebC/TACO1
MVHQSPPTTRRVLTKHNCTLGNGGSVSWMFDAKGVIVADLDHPDLQGGFV